jgi:DNA ligase-1
VDVLKYKQWQDAEYEVVGIETSTQRLSVHGKYGEHEALAAVLIEHKGHRVAVGTGFTTTQRLMFRRPENIVGRTITVEYFGESEVPGREGKSLRFPRVKMVWEDQKGRNI